MKRTSILGSLVVLLCLVAGVGPAAEPVGKVPEIPGLTAPDKFPKACVSCHRQYPDLKKDHRLTTELKKWETEVDFKYRVKARAAAPQGLKIEGRHPQVGHLVKKVPGDCLMCHWSQSKTTPPFARLVHLIHLENSPDNHFLTNYGGVCTHCHKLDVKTGTWTLPNNPEE